MDRAYSLSDNQGHDAEELWQLDNADAHEWVCWVCRGHRMIPKAWDHERRMREKNKPYKKRPYFAAAADQGEHVCDGNFNQAVREGKKKKVLNTDAPPVPVYSSLILREIRNYVPPDGDDVGGDVPPRDIYQGPALGGRRDRMHNREAGTIRPLCKQYVWFPKDIYDQRLDTGGRIDGATYREVFEVLRCTPLNHRFVGARIFIGKIVFEESVNITNEGNTITIPISDSAEWGEYEREDGSMAKRPCRFRKVKVDTGNWTAHAKTALLRELNDTRSEARRGEDGEPYVFFLGLQDAEDPLLFHCEDKRLICSFMANI